MEYSGRIEIARDSLLAEIDNHCTAQDLGEFIRFNGISTLDGYLMPNPIYLSIYLPK